MDGTGSPKDQRRRDLRRWCEGVKGVEHEVEIRLFEHKGVPLDCRNKPDYWELCYHYRACKVCGRNLGYVSPGECPLRQG